MQIVYIYNKATIDSNNSFKQYFNTRDVYSK